MKKEIKEEKKEEIMIKHENQENPIKEEIKAKIAMYEKDMIHASDKEAIKAEINGLKDQLTKI